MKNLSVALNAILLVLIVILFVMFNNLKKGIGQDGNTETSIGKNKLLRIAYVNADSITANYLLMKDFNADIHQKEAQIQEVYNTKAKKLQDEYQAYMQKKQSGNTSQIEDERVGKELQTKKDELDEVQQQHEELIKDVQQRNFELQKKIQKFISDYNKKTKFDYILRYDNVAGSMLYGNDSMDITKPIVAGLNQQYKDSLQKTSSGTGVKH